MTVTDFLLARIAEDEASARDWLDGGYQPPAWGPEDRPEHISDFYDAPTEADRLQVARVLRECEAKRRIAALHRNRYGLGDCESCADGWEDHTSGDAMHNPLLYPCPTLRALASVYADHPDYDQAWA